MESDPNFRNFPKFKKPFWFRFGVLSSRSQMVIPLRSASSRKLENWRKIGVRFQLIAATSGRNREPQAHGSPAEPAMTAMGLRVLGENPDTGCLRALGTCAEVVGLA